MHRRPWEVWILSLVYLAAPVSNLAFTAWQRHLAWDTLGWIFLALDPLDQAALVNYPFLAAAVWSVSRPGWWVFVVLNAFLVGHNLWLGWQMPGANLVLVAGANLATVAVAALLFTPHARSPYFSPRVRWWNEGRQLFIAEVLDVPVVLTWAGGQAEGRLLDVGTTGCFVETAASLGPAREVGLAFECWGINLHLTGRPVRQGPAGTPLAGWGFRFVKTTREQRGQMQALVAALAQHRAPVSG